MHLYIMKCPFYNSDEISMLLYKGIQIMKLCHILIDNQSLNQTADMDIQAQCDVAAENHLQFPLDRLNAVSYTHLRQ